MEYMAVAGPRFDLDRFGAALPRFTPWQADLLMVVGTVSHKQAQILKRVYDQMCEPKWVMAFGACATSGGFYRNYAVVQGIDRIIPVDIFVAGCPPRPEQLISSVLDLQEKIQRTGTINAREFANRGQYEGPVPLVTELTADELVVAPGDYTTGMRLQDR